MQIFFFFFFIVEKCLKISQILHGGDRRHIKVRKKTKISKSTDESFSTPKPKTICPYLKIAWPVRLVPCFVGVHHIFVQK